MPQWRTPRSLMVLVAVAASLLFGADRIASLRVEAANYRAVASLHATKVKSAEKALKLTGDQKLREWLIRLSRYHRTLERKYRRAAERPWSKVMPDPPPPPLSLL